VDLTLRDGINFQEAIQMARQDYDNAHFETDIEEGMDVVEGFYANENSEIDQVQAELKAKSKVKLH